MFQYDAALLGAGWCCSCAPDCGCLSWSVHLYSSPRPAPAITGRSVRARAGHINYCHCHWSTQYPNQPTIYVCTGTHWNGDIFFIPLLFGANKIQLGPYHYYAFFWNPLETWFEKHLKKLFLLWSLQNIMND